MIYLGADHAGFKLKEEIKKYLSRLGQRFKDLGNTKYDPSDDYPDFAYKVAKHVAREKTKGILICATGQGMNIVANKVKGIYASYCGDVKSAKLAKKHGQANIITLGAEAVNVKQAKKIVRAWLSEPFSGAARHKRRINKIKKIERCEFR